MRINTDPEKIKTLLSRNVDEVIDKDHLLRQLNSGKELRVKLGIDPTSPNIHIGRAVLLWKLRAFQDLGHRVIFIVGDFTGIVGDTSDKDSERPMLKESEVKKNLKTYLKQAFKILDKKRIETHFNSKWLKKLGFLEIGKMADLFGLHEFESRENIARRLKAGKRVSVRELLYPLMQGYDSVAVKADVELGGTDQRFNLLAGRTIQAAYGQRPQDILMTTFPLEGTDGRKMSSSWGNVINITDEPDNMFGSVMSAPDELVKKYFEMATNLSSEKINEAMKLKPIESKERLAFEITSLYHGEKSAKAAKKFFEETFRNRKLPEDIPAAFFTAGAALKDILMVSGAVSSVSAFRQLIKQKAIEIDQEIISDPNFKPDKAGIIRIGKKKFLKIAPK